VTRGHAHRPIYVETRVHAPMDDLWEKTQQPELHQRHYHYQAREPVMSEARPAPVEQDPRRHGHQGPGQDERRGQGHDKQDKQDKHGER
jgi:hypothetical protein